MKNKNIKKIDFFLAFLLVILLSSHFLLSNFVIAPKKEEFYSAEDELEFLTQLEQKYHSRTYKYYNITYDQTVDFVNSSKTSNIHDIFIEAEEQSLYSAIVETIMGENLLMYELIGFNTTDKGFVCFEPDTAYEVKPEIGKRYIDCVVGYPYSANIFNDTIRDILIIW